MAKAANTENGMKNSWDSLPGEGNFSRTCPTHGQVRVTGGRSPCPIADCLTPKLKKNGPEAIKNPNPPTRKRRKGKKDGKGATSTVAKRGRPPKASTTANGFALFNRGITLAAELIEVAGSIDAAVNVLEALRGIKG